MRVYGNTRVHAPNFNKLTDECVVFRNPYSTQPVCTPARSSVLTGLWPHTNGCVTNGIPLPKTTPAFPELLADSDYRTGYFGKWHLGDELFPQHGFEEWVSIEDIYGRSFGSDRDRDQRSTYDQFLRERGQKPDLPNDRFSREFAARLPSRAREAALPRAEDDRFSDGVTATSPSFSTSTSWSRTRPTTGRSTTGTTLQRSSCHRTTWFLREKTSRSPIASRASSTGSSARTGNRPQQPTRVGGD